MTDFSYSDSSPLPEKTQAWSRNHNGGINLSHQTGRAWPKASGMEKHSYQTGYSKISEDRPLFGMCRV